MESFTPDQQPLQASRATSSLFAKTILSGSYLVLVGPGGDDGLDLPPATWIAFGPYDLKGDTSTRVDRIPGREVLAV